MKIRFLKTLTLDVENPRMEDVWYKTFPKWKELSIEEIYTTANGRYVTLKTTDGDYILNVPVDSFEKLKEEKRPIVF